MAHSSQGEDKILTQNQHLLGSSVYLIALSLQKRSFQEKSKPYIYVTPISNRVAKVKNLYLWGNQFRGEKTDTEFKLHDGHRQ